MFNKKEKEKIRQLNKIIYKTQAECIHLKKQLEEKSVNEHKLLTIQAQELAQKFIDKRYDESLAIHFAKTFINEFQDLWFHFDATKPNQTSSSKQQ